MLNHFDGRRHGVDIGCNADKINRAVAALDNVALVVGASDIRHDRNFQIGIVVADDIIDILIAAELPLAELLRVKQISRCLIAEFHVIDASFLICLVQVTDKLVGEVKIVAQAAVADGRVHDTDILTECHQISSFCHCLVPFCAAYKNSLLQTQEAESHISNIL